MMNSKEKDEYVNQAMERMTSMEHIYQGFCAIMKFFCDMLNL